MARPLTKKYCRSAWLREKVGSPIQPCRRNPPLSRSRYRHSATKGSPQSFASRCSCASRSPAARSRHRVRRLWFNSMATPGRLSAIRRTTSSTWRNSVASVRRNLRRAGVLKKRSRTSTVVPTGWATGSGASKRSLPSPRTCQPLSASGVREASSSRLTEAMLGRASPRKPRLTTRSRSSRSAILLVACRDSARVSSSRGMPRPSSRTRISRRPPCSMSIARLRAPASRLFSSSSLRTEAGRSTTSPAAIWLTSCGGSRRMGMGGFYHAARRPPTRGRKRNIRGTQLPRGMRNTSPTRRRSESSPLATFSSRRDTS